MIYVIGFILYIIGVFGFIVLLSTLIDACEKEPDVPRPRIMG